jgi:hypothetical protein
MRLAWIVLAATTATARADSSKLDEAKRAIDEVRYDDAQRLLVAAIKDGGNSAVAMRQIYQLSASTAIVLGQTEVGQQYYRRWLALDPNAAIPESVSPKLRAVFVAAQADMAAKGAIAVSASHDGADVDVSIVSDPLAMARGGCAINGGAMVPFDAHGHARLANDTRVAVCDESNNRLVEVNVSTPVVATSPPVRAPNPLPIMEPVHHSAFGRPSTWWLLGGLNVPASLICLGLALRPSADGSPHTGLIIASSITGGAAIVGITFGTILYLGREDQPRVAVTPTRGGAALSFTTRF